MASASVVNRTNINNRLSSESLAFKLEKFKTGIITIKNSCQKNIDNPKFPFIDFINNKIRDFTNIFNDFNSLYKYSMPNIRYLTHKNGTYNNSNNDNDYMREKIPDFDEIKICDFLDVIQTMTEDLINNLNDQIDITKIKKKKSFFNKLNNETKRQKKLSDDTQANIDNILSLLHYLKKKYNQDYQQKNNNETKDKTRKISSTKKNSNTKTQKKGNNPKLKKSVQNAIKLVEEKNNILFRTLNKTGPTEEEINSQMDELSRSKIIDDITNLLEKLKLWSQYCNILVDTRQSMNIVRHTKNKNRHRNIMFEIMEGYFEEYKLIMNDICTLHSDSTQRKIKKNINIKAQIDAEKDKIEVRNTYNICYLVEYLRKIIVIILNAIKKYNNPKLGFKYDIHGNILQSIYLIFESIIEYKNKYNEDADFEKYDASFRLQRLLPDHITKSIDFSNDEFNFSTDEFKFM